MTTFLLVGAAIVIAYLGVILYFVNDERKFWRAAFLYLSDDTYGQLEKGGVDADRYSECVNRVIAASKERRIEWATTQNTVDFRHLVEKASR